MCKIISDIEYLIGSECYNPNSYDGWSEIEGCDFRYPINVPDPIVPGEYIKIKDNINTTYQLDHRYISSRMISYMKYKFGSNELYIGQGIIKTLRYLEDRYDIDFNELEENRSKKVGK